MAIVNMIIRIIFFLNSLSFFSCEFGCYWNNNSKHLYYGSKTPYETVRGDLRNYKKLKDCEAVSFWSLHRHGNRFPGKANTMAMKAIAGLKDDIVAAYDEGSSLLCAEDIDELRKWTWNDALETSYCDLSEAGYREMYGIGDRVKAAYPELLNGKPEEYNFYSANEQRASYSAKAFVDGLSAGTNISLKIDDSKRGRDISLAYKLCPRYQKSKFSAFVKEKAALESSADYIAIRTGLQKRLGISYKITTADVFMFYEFCRFYRAWDPNFRSPWCAFFSNEDLMVLEYKDDIKHYYKNGYGFWMNPHIGALLPKDLYHTFESAIHGQGKKMVSYFTLNPLVQMVFSALGLYKDPEPLRGAHRDENRLWKSRYQAAKAISLMAVLNKCQESDTGTYRVQIFIAEKLTDLCPVEGCTWPQFQKKFEPFTNATLDFCSLDYPEPEDLISSYIRG